MLPLTLSVLELPSDGDIAVATSASAPRSAAMSGVEPAATSPAAAPAKAIAEVIAITTRDDFLLELGASLAGQMAVTPVESMARALEHAAGSRHATQLLAIDTRDASDVRAEIEQSQARAPHLTILVFAAAESEKTVAGALKGSNVFAVLPIPIDQRKTFAVCEGAMAETAKRAARPATHSGEPKTSEPKASEPRTDGDSGLSHEQATLSRAGADVPGDEPPNRKLLVIAAGVVAVLLAGGGLWFLTKGGKEADTAGTSKPGEAAAAAEQSASAPAEEAAPLEVKLPEEVPLVSGTVDELLEKARLAMRERRYTEPATNNALLYYRSALGVDPANGEAKDGLNRVANLLMARVDEALDAAHHDDAAGALAALRLAIPQDPRIGPIESRVMQAQVNKAFADSNLDRAAVLIRQAQQFASISPDQLTKWKAELARRQEEAKAKRLVDLIDDSIRNGRLTEPEGANAKEYVKQLRELPPPYNNAAQRASRNLIAAYLRKGREASVAGRTNEAERWVAEARAAGASSTEISAHQRDVANAKQRAASAEAERSVQLARERIRDGRLTEPAQDSAVHHLTQARNHDGDNSAVSAAAGELTAKLIERASAAAAEGKTAQVDADLAMARRWGADASSIQAVQRIAATRKRNGQEQRTPPPPPPIAKLHRVRYAAPEYPAKAMNAQLSGSVTIDFTVDVNGEPRDLKVVHSEPAEIFDRAALTAVRRWRYEPVIVNNVPTEVPTRTVIRFQLPD